MKYCQLNNAMEYEDSQANRDKQKNRQRERERMSGWSGQPVDQNNGYGMK